MTRFSSTLTIGVSIAALAVAVTGHALAETDHAHEATTVDAAAIAIAGNGELSSAQTVVLNQEALEASGQALRLFSSVSQLSGDIVRRDLADMLAASGLDRRTTQAIANETLRDLDSEGVSHLHWDQRVSGLRVHGAYVRAAFNEQGELIHLMHRLAPLGELEPAAPRISAQTALKTAIAAAFGEKAPTPGVAQTEDAVTTFDDNSYYFQAPTVEQIVIAKSDGGVEQGFVAEIWRDSDNLLYQIVVDGDGAIVASELRTSNDRYRVYQRSPGVAGQQIAFIPNSGTTHSPAGWLRPVTQGRRWIRGNNVSAYLDRNENDNPDTFGALVSNREFLSTTNLSIDPNNGSNPDAAVTNLFYHNNIIHDRLRGHGFTEAWGNFQVDNFGLGGAGGDAVNAEAQDGSLLANPPLNNANFATPGDGSAPRMQMYLWNRTTPRRDGSLDNDVIYHEYGHGLTWRMVGGMSGSVSGALGEGMSDVIAILMNGEDRVGEYSTNDPDGIRSERYRDHTETLGDFNAARGVHRNGEIYAAAVWRLYEIFQREGISSFILMDYVVRGLRFTPSNPTYIQMRDGLLAATPSNRDCLVWEAFAAKGMGLSATMTAGGATSESFGQPSSCAFRTRFRVSDAGTTEGGNLWFLVTRSGLFTSSQSNSVQYRTLNGSARAPGDYSTRSGTLSFSPGQTSRYVIVPTNNDTFFELTETMNLRLSLPTGNASLSDNNGVGSIRNRLVAIPGPIITSESEQDVQ